jgi:hypothetical protein
VLSDEIDDAPAVVALLNMLKRKRCYLGPPQPAAEQNGKHRAIA